jgi:peroxiredoxin
MNPTKKIIFAAAVLIAAWSTAARAAVSVGASAPDFSVTDIQGKTHRLADYKGKTVVLEWTNPQCPFVRKHYESGNIPQLQKTATSEGVVWLAIESARGKSGRAEDAKAAAWLKEQDAAPTAFLRDADTSVARLYGAKATPHLFVIDRAGVVVYNGAIDSIRSADQADIAKAENYVSSALAALKAGRPVEKAATQPYGCAVKY